MILKKKKTMSKAENRFQEQKHKKKTIHIIKDIWREPNLAKDEKFVGIEAGVHSKRCSCPMCSRSRKNPWAKTDRLPINERRAFQKEINQLNEGDDNEKM